jgi:hypothetical protein
VASEPSLSPLATIYLPPVLGPHIEAIMMQQVHPAWQKLRKEGSHYIVRTNSLDDLSEMADWARTALVEPELPLTKGMKQAFQTVVNRTARWAVIEPLGPCHCIASKWREGKPRSRMVIKTDGTLKEVHKEG